MTQEEKIPKIRKFKHQPLNPRISDNIPQSIYANTLIGNGFLVDPFRINPDIILQNNILQIVSSIVPHTPIPRPIYIPGSDGNWQSVAYHSSSVESMY